MSRHPPSALPFAIAMLVAAGGCGGAAATDAIAIDGSSTVFPITEAIAEEFNRAGKGHVAIGVSGTAGGLKKLCRAEIAISGASRPIKPAEAQQCEQAGVEYIELPVAYDGIAVAVHPDNDWATSMTVAELELLWKPNAQGAVTRWKDIRAEWPDDEIHLFGAGVHSGTYDYFTKAIVGKEHSSRGDFTSSEDDNVLVQGVSRDKNALGFFGLAYYAENTAKLRIVAIDDGNPENGDGPIAPSIETVTNGTYQPLSRPIFVYVSRLEADRSAVGGFVEFYLNEGAELIREVGYTPLSEATYALVRERFAAKTTGSLFGADGSLVGASIEDALAKG